MLIVDVERVYRKAVLLSFKGGGACFGWHCTRFFRLRFLLGLLMGVLCECNGRRCVVLKL
jgi:hypothetical protein